MSKITALLAKYGFPYDNLCVYSTLSNIQTIQTLRSFLPTLGFLGVVCYNHGQCMYQLGFKHFYFFRHFACLAYYKVSWFHLQFQRFFYTPLLVQIWSNYKSVLILE